MSKKSYKLSDEVWFRVIQVIQESMLMGSDCSESLQAIEVEFTDDQSQLTLTENYMLSVADMHEKWLKAAEDHIEKQNLEAEQTKILN